MKYTALALLFASTSAINIRTAGGPPDPEENTCVNVRKNTGIEEPCSTPGNSAWVPDAPVPAPEDLGLEAGWNGYYYWFSNSATSDGYDTTGLKPSADVVTQEINFANQ
tara:strand:- start:431 stop:757 length:327 start_codon:yes stop_codon:yes gene_type:complete